ncbi:21024_t:CDS:2, partial [Dentiscutata erythropus]
MAINSVILQHRRKPISYLDLAELELCHRILQQTPSQPHHAPIAPAILDIISQQLAFPMADMQKMIQNTFAKQHNSDHITKLEGGHKDVPISIKYKNKWITETGHVVVIDIGKPDYLLCLETPWIRK